MEKTENKYIEGIGRRKTAIARVRLTPASANSVSINDRSVEDYFKTVDLQTVCMEALTKNKLPEKFKITIKVLGGGINSQAEAIRHGMARAMIKYDVELRKKLKKAGFLMRDQRAKERRKFGLKKARKAPQWSKR